MDWDKWICPTELKIAVRYIRQNVLFAENRSASLLGLWNKTKKDNDEVEL